MAGFIDPPSLLLKEVNIIRVHGYQCGDQKMPPVDTISWNPELAIIAHQHAQDMHTKNYFSHYNLSKQDVSLRADSIKYEWNQIGENIAIGYQSNYDVMRAWLESDEHCEMILYPYITEMGAARAGEYWVINFGRPDLVLAPVKK